MIELNFTIKRNGMILYNWTGFYYKIQYAAPVADHFSGEREEQSFRK